MKILLITFNLVGPVMAGPAVRYHEMAEQLAKKQDVALAAPSSSQAISKNYRLVSHQEIRQEISQADVVIAQRLTSKWALWMAWYRPFYIMDGYDPLPLENLELFKEAPLSIQRNKHIEVVEFLKLAIASADGVLYACPTQKDLWAGFWMAENGFDPARYQEDPTFESRLAHIPFGLSEIAPTKNEEIRKLLKIKKEDIFLIWGGGVWNWFDPLVLIRAVFELETEGLNVKLFYMGSSSTAAYDRARTLAKDLGVLDRLVLFNEGWIPYDKRGEYLAAADIGVSCHLKRLETRYSFRTRVLDYLWAGLPMVLTEGDFFSELVEEKGAGIAVHYEDVKSVKEAIRKIALNPLPYKEKSRELAKAFYWEKCVKPLYNMLEFLQNTKPKRVSLFKIFRLKSYLCLRSLR